MRARVVSLVAAVAAALILLTGLSFYLAKDGQADNDLLIETVQPARIDAETLTAAMLDQETGVRGYALTADRADLRPYLAGRAQEARLLTGLRRNLSGFPGAGETVGRIASAAAGWRAAVAEPLIVSVGAGDQAAGQRLVNDSSRQQFDGIRALIRELQSELIRIRTELTGRLQEAREALLLLLIVAGAVIVTAGVALLTLMSRLVTRPVVDLCGQIRQVAAGDFIREIHETGPPELARLAADVNGMRRRIVHDLAQVRAARGEVEQTGAKLAELNEQLTAQAEELARSNRDLEQFAYVASHDLQEPLRKVASFCQLLQRRYAGQLDDKADQYIAFAVDGAQRMQRLINDLLAFSRIGRASNAFVDVDLDLVMGQVNEQVDEARSANGAALVWSGLPTVRGEDSLLVTLFANLVGNALKFRDPERPPRIEVTARRDGDDWEIAVADNGIGIGAEYADKVFVIFQRLHGRDAYPGTGIGLAMVKKIVEYHGGRIWLDTDVESGATFRLTMPAVPDPATDPANPQPGAASHNSVEEFAA
ncbi:ATP-binding protein [Pilimelia columellifera subsp. columellifera]|uniref:histidine kinase n=1 Tax=Pilimelia columellifera subsp. columellifera TaxID=706583 RepID=A0ABN3NG57_9ACTN